MFLTEEKDMETIELDDIAVDYELLTDEKIKVNDAKISLYFGKDKLLDSISPITFCCPFEPGGVGIKEVNIKYEPVEFDSDFSMDALPDGIFDADEIDGKYLVNVQPEDLYDLAAVLEASFTREIIWPFDNTSKNDMVNKELAKRDDVASKIKYYIEKGITSVEEFKSVHQSWSNQQTREKKKQDAIDKWRAGRTNLEILRDELKQNKNVVSAEITDKPSGKFTKLLRVIFKGRKIYDISSNNNGTFLSAKKLGDMFNSYRAYDYKAIENWVLTSFKRAQEQEMLGKMTNRERMEYNLKKARNLPKEESDDDEDDFDTSWLDDEDEKLERSRR